MKNIVSIFFKSVITTLLTYLVFDEIVRIIYKFIVGARTPDNSVFLVYLPIIALLAGSVYVNKKHPSKFWFIIIGCISLMAIFEVVLMFVPAPR